MMTDLRERLGQLQRDHGETLERLRPDRTAPRRPPTGDGGQTASPEVEAVRDAMGAEIAGLRASIEELRGRRSETEEVAALKREVAQLRGLVTGLGQGAEGSEVDRLRQEIEELRRDKPQNSGMTTEITALGTQLEHTSLASREKPPRRSRALRWLSLLLIVAAFVAIPLFAVHRSSCGDRATPRYEWSVGLPSQPPGKGCWERKSGLEVVVSSI